MPRITSQFLRSRARGPLSTLEYLDISNHRFDAIERLNLCPKLQTLLLRGNCIFFVDNLDSCPNLWHIDLSCNQIQSLDGLKKFLAFGTVILSDNNISWNELGKIRHVHILNLSLHGNKQLEKDPYYRIHVIDSLPNVWALDGRFITSAERIQVKQFFQDSALSERPVRHKFTQDAFMSTQVKEICRTGLFGSKASHMISSFPANAIHNVDMDRKKLKYLAYNLQNDLVLQKKYTKCELLVLQQQETFLETILEARVEDRESCNMLLVLLVGSLQFVLPTHLVKLTLETAHLTKFKDVYSMALFLLPREIRCRVVSILLGAVKIDKDVHEDGGLYDKLYLCLFHTISELTRISQSCDVSSAARDSKQKSLFKDNKVLLATEIVQLMCLVPAFFEYIVKDSGVGNLVITATGDRTIIETVGSIAVNPHAEEEQLQKYYETVSSLLAQKIHDNLGNVANRKPRLTPGEHILHVSKAFPMKTCKTPVFSADFHTKGLSSPNLGPPAVTSKKLLIGPPQPFPHLGDLVLLGPQTVGKVISLPQPFIGLVAMDAIPMTNGAMEYRLQDPDDHYSYINMSMLEWDAVYCLWKPKGSVGDSDIPDPQKKRYMIDSAQALQQELKRRAETSDETRRPNSPEASFRSPRRRKYSGGQENMTTPLIYTSRMPSASNIQHKSKEMTSPRPMSSVLKEKLDLRLTTPRPMSAFPALLSGPPPTPVTSQDPGGFSIRTMDMEEDMRRSYATNVDASAQVSARTLPSQAGSRNTNDSSNKDSQAELSPSLSGGPSLDTDVGPSRESDVKLNLESGSRSNQDTDTELNQNTNATTKGGTAVSPSQDIGAKPEQGAEASQNLNAAAPTSQNQNAAAPTSQNQNAAAPTSQNQNASAPASQNQNAAAQEIQDAGGGLKDGEVNKTENATVPGREAMHTENLNQEVVLQRNGHSLGENGVPGGEEGKEKGSVDKSEFLQLYGRKEGGAPSSPSKQLLHMSQISTRVSIQMPNVNDGASEDHSSRLEEESARKMLLAQGQPPAPVIRSSLSNRQLALGRPRAVAKHGRPCSAVEGSRYIASPRVNVRPDSASTYQRLRVQAWKSNSNTPTFSRALKEKTNQENALVVYPPQRPSSPDSKESQVELMPCCVKVKRVNDWLAGGRDLHWEMMRQRPRSSHVPGWKEGLPPSMKRRPRSAVTTRTRYYPISCREIVLQPSSHRRLRKPLSASSSSKTLPSEALVPGRPPTPELPHLLDDRRPTPSLSHPAPRPGSPADWGDLLFDPAVPELVYRGLRRVVLSPCLQCIYENALEWYGPPSSRSNTTHASKMV